MSTALITCVSRNAVAAASVLSAGCDADACPCGKQKCVKPALEKILL